MSAPVIAMAAAPLSDRFDELLAYIDELIDQGELSREAERIANILDAWEFTSREILRMDDPHRWDLTFRALGEPTPSEPVQLTALRMIQAREAAREKARKAKEQR